MAKNGKLVLAVDGDFGHRDERIMTSADSFDNKKQLVGGGTFAALSFDDGKTWSHVRKVEGPKGYLSLAQSPNGVIYLLGPNGSNIRCVAFNEAWVKDGKPLKPKDDK